MDQGEYYFDVRLLIRHPNIDPLEISQTLNLTADRSWKVGDQRNTPSGTSLEGVHKLTSWSYNWQYVGERHFFALSENILHRFEHQRGFFTGITTDGGETHLIISLFGRFNIGDSATSNFLKMLNEMDIQLGVDVFPEWNKAEIALG